MTIKRRCDMCHELFEGRRCPACSKKVAAKSKRKALEADEGRKLYHSGLWERCRRNVRMRFGDYDIWLLAKGIEHVCQHPFIHHIIPREEAPDLILNLDNLVTVTKESHEEIHQWYNKGLKNQAIERLRTGVMIYMEKYYDGGFEE